MSAALQNAKGPARIAVLPSHDSTNPRKDTEMNSTDTTTAAPAAASEDGSPSLYSLFALYWSRYAVLDQAMKRTDATEYDTPEHDAALELQIEVGEHLNDALLEICAFRPRLRFDARFKAEFLTSIVAGDCGKLEADAMAALLSSLPDLVLWSSHQGMEVGQ